MNSDKKMQNVECLRFLFTLGICVHHFLFASGLYSNGYLAVEFFFILSGFLLVYTFNARKTVTTFIKSKIIRFVPILFFVSLLYCCFTSDFYFDSLVSNTLFLFFDMQPSSSPKSGKDFAEYLTKSLILVSFCSLK